MPLRRPNGPPCARGAICRATGGVNRLGRAVKWPRLRTRESCEAASLFFLSLSRSSSIPGQHTYCTSRSGAPGMRLTFSTDTYFARAWRTSGGEERLFELAASAKAPGAERALERRPRKLFTLGSSPITKRSTSLVGRATPNDDAPSSITAALPLRRSPPLEPEAAVEAATRTALMMRSAPRRNASSAEPPPSTMNSSMALAAVPGGGDDEAAFAFLVPPALTCRRSSICMESP